jgi:hypothetical protein
MYKFLIPVAGSVLLLALGAAVSAAGVAPGLAHSAAALRAVADCAADPATLAASSEAARHLKATPGRAPFVLSPFGQVPPPEPESLPADPTVRTRNGLYATHWQAEDLDRLLGGAVVWVDVGCCGEAAIDLAQGHVAGMMAADDLADDAAVFVVGTDLAAAALLVDRLAEQRLTRVFLVTR